MPEPHARLTSAAPVVQPTAEVRVCQVVLAALARAGEDPAVVHLDRLVGLVAARQHRVVTIAQLRALGATRGQIAGRVRRGLLRPLHRGVYLWGAPEPTFHGRAQAAALACGHDAVLSHVHAAALWRLLGEPDGDPHVIAPQRVRVRGVRCHQTALDRHDVRVHGGIPVTAPARTLLDLAGILPPRQLADALERARVARLVTRGQIVAAIERAPACRPGAAHLRALAAEPAFTRSRAERRLLALVRAAGLPEPECNARVEGHEVDALWRAQRVVLEFDSYAFHATRTAFERDRRRDADLQRARHVVLRTTWGELAHAPYALVARLAEALAVSARATPSSRARGGP